MESKEVRNWRSEEALERYRMIMPLLDSEIDNAKRCMLREQIANREELSVRTIYRYEKQYKEDQFEGLLPKHREAAFTEAAGELGGDCCGSSAAEERSAGEERETADPDP